MGSGALSLRSAILIAAVMEFFGAFLLGGNVATTITKNITNAELYSDKPEVLSQYAFGTRKEAEEYRDLALYAMKLNYGDDQTMFNFEIFEQYSFL